MLLTDWKPSKSDHTLPNVAPARQMQYRRYLHYETDMSGFGIQTRTGTGKWKIQVLFGDVLLFEQQVELSILIVGLRMVYTWAFSREKIITTYIEPSFANIVNPASGLVAPISISNTSGSSGMIYDAANHNLTVEEWQGLGSPSWERILGGSAPASEFGTLIPGGGSGTTTGTAYIDAFWQSPLFVMDLPVGAELHVVMDSWGLGISTRPEWQWRFLAGSYGFGATIDRQGAIRTALENSDGVNLNHTYDSQLRRFQRSQIADASKPRIFRDACSRIYVLALKGNRWMLWYSDYGGFDIWPMTYNYTHLPDGGDVAAGDQVALWSDSFSDVDITPRRGRGYASCAARGGQVYVLSSADGIVPGPMKAVCPTTDRPFRILSGATSDGRARLELLDGGDAHYESLDGGIEWNAVL